MPPKSGIVWVEPPGKLIRALQENDTRTLAAVYALAIEYGATMLSEARQNASWHDRTGNARSGLVFVVEGFGRASLKRGGRTRDPETGSGGRSSIEVLDTELVILLGHTMHYGVYLELSNGGRYAIIWPTITKNVGLFMKDLNRLLG